jgi:hypothetical protein
MMVYSGGERYRVCVWLCPEINPGAGWGFGWRVGMDSGDLLVAKPADARISWLRLLRTPPESFQP